MPVVWSDRHRLHEPGGEVWVGVRTPGTELPARAERIRESLTEAGARFVAAGAQPDDAVLAVHDPALLAYLADAWADWEAAGLTEDPGQDRVVPYLFPHPDLLSDRPPAIPTAIDRPGRQFAYDTMTLIGPGTWEAARAAVDAAVTAADLVLGGEPAAYACCRPPGHHASRDCFGGSCYLNNTAAAAARLRGAVDGPVAVHRRRRAPRQRDPGDLLRRPRRPGRLGTRRPGGRVVSPLSRVRRGDRRGGRYRGEPQPAVGPGRRRRAVARGGRRPRGVGARAGGAQALVVALGVDAAAGDPESPLRVSAGGFRAAGRALGALGLPTVVVQEGGYDLAAIGALVHEALAGIEEGSAASDHRGASSLEAPRTDPRPTQGWPQADAVSALGCYAPSRREGPFELTRGTGTVSDRSSRILATGGRLARAARVFATDPVEAVINVQAKVAEREELRASRTKGVGGFMPWPPCPYEVDEDWERSLHELVGAQWPCAATDGFWELWSRVIRLARGEEPPAWTRRLCRLGRRRAGHDACGLVPSAPPPARQGR